MAGTGLQPAIIAILFLFPALSTSIVAVRFWRRIVERSFAGEDVVLAAAMALAIAFAFVNYAAVKANYEGYHEADVPHDAIDLEKVIRLQYTISIIYNPILCLVKASFCWTLMRLQSPRIWLNRWLWIIQIVNALYMVGSTLASILACVPIQKNFDRTVPGSCYNTAVYVVTSVCIVIITDIMVIVVPSWMIYDLHMPLLRKFITISFLSLGLAVTAIGIVSLEYIIRLFVDHAYSRHSMELTYSTMETNLAIIGACGPTVKWILARCMPFLELSQKPSTGNYSVPNHTSSRTSRAQRRSQAMGNGSGAAGHDMTMSKPDDEMELRPAVAWKNRHLEASESTEGILQTVEWDVSSRDPSTVSARGGGSGGGDTAIRPTDVV